MPRLTISRRVGQKVWIGDSICVEVTDLARGQVRLTIEAPKEVRILREEIREPNQKGDDDAEKSS